ncbi:uncharacterized protein I303_107727 [Kwoniella dejecticola CBS 10117]|uniref:Uncharacterized protein n=1 Tax=Kwoniella dejecticola CBS 10117 TaxID=1296121 RepID=A0A1A5ZVJ3_9TREE|nr:uncharacterized protein I303_07732 [Kwoniella dejecticola CBS 10117]OBR81822.1 hypothetical protein I303_07732 [Kwoniella dejecticola CBS 10117]
MSAQFDLSPRERMFMAKMALLESEKEERAKYKLARRESRRLSMAASLNSEVPQDEPVASSTSSSRSESIVKPCSILRKSSKLPPSSYQPPTSPKAAQGPIIPSSPAPSLPLPPAPKIAQNSDFGPSISLPSPTASSSTNALRRRSSRVRFSDQQLQPNFNPHSVSRSTSMKSLRRESSIDGLRADLIQASYSLNSRKSSTASQSLGRRLSAASIGSSYKRDSFASSVGSDPFNWATSSYGSDIDMQSDLDMASRKQSLAIGIVELGELDQEVLARMNEEEEQGFKPQILPYPKISRAGPASNSRFSIESTTSSVWRTQPQDQLSDRSDNQSIYSAIDSPSSEFVGDGYMSRKSSQFSLEAKLRTSLSDSATSGTGTSRKSSYQPSLAHTPDSLRSSTSDAEFQARCHSTNTANSMNFQLPGRAYSSLLPSRRRRSSLLSISILPNDQEHLPHINRGEWDDPEMGLSPRSGPVRIVGSVSGSSRRGTKLAEEILMQASPEMAQVPNAGEPEGYRPTEGKSRDGSSQDSIDLLPLLPSPLRSTFVNTGETERETPKKGGHSRTDSSFSAIMSFPIPPDRVVEMTIEDQVDDLLMEHQILPTVLPSLSSPLLGENDDTPTIEKIIQLPIKPVLEDTTSIPTPHMADEPRVSQVISLNSPFSDSEGPHTMPQAMQIDPPSPEVVPVDSAVLAEDPTCPSSPELHDILRTVRRPRIARSTSESALPAGAENETEESDLDVASPLMKVALHSHILSPQSRLLAPPSPCRPASIRSVSTNSVDTLSSLRSGLGLTSGRGWSGSESEEEEWMSTARQIKERRSRSTFKSPKTPQPLKAAKSNMGTGTGYESGLMIQVDIEMEDTPTPTKTKRFSSSSFTSSTSTSTSTSSGGSGNIKTQAKTNRYSQLSEISTVASTTTEGIPLTPQTLEILTPSLVGLGLSRSNSNVSSGSSTPGNFPWGLSSPPNSPIRGLFANNAIPKKDLITSFRNSTSTGKAKDDVHFSSRSKNQKKKDLPRPTREIDEDCWGEPEILIDQQGHSASDDSEIDENLERSLRSSISSLSLKSDISVLADRYGQGQGSKRRSTIKPLAQRSTSPDLWLDGEGPGEDSLMDERMPDM